MNFMVDETINIQRAGMHICMDMENRIGDINLRLGINISTNALQRKKSLLGNHKADRTYHASSSSCFGQLGPRPSWSRRLRPDASGDPNRNTKTNTNTIKKEVENKHTYVKHKQLQKQLEHDLFSG